MMIRSYLTKGILKFGAVKIPGNNNKDKFLSFILGS